MATRLPAAHLEGRKLMKAEAGREEPGRTAEHPPESPPKPLSRPGSPGPYLALILAYYALLVALLAYASHAIG